MGLRLVLPPLSRTPKLTPSDSTLLERMEKERGELDMEREEIENRPIDHDAEQNKENEGKNDLETYIESNKNKNTVKKTQQVIKKFR